ncbi:MAG: hypothetical protein IPM77_04960 [Crocinitomicaceae bacterium]|nr:hypothetical protein [Crocinitomicaceae bacterium]
MKKFILLFLLFIGGFSSQNAMSQCNGICGGFGGFCFCDDACWIFGDCCADMCTYCPTQGPNSIANCGPPPPPPPPPCVAAPVPNDACYALVIALDPTCCNTV